MMRWIALLIVLHLGLCSGAMATNSFPVAVSDSYTTWWRTPLKPAAPGVLTNDFDPDGSNLKAILWAGPANGSLNLSTNGSFTYNPNSSFAGTDTFSYVTFDGAVSSTPATVTIVVNTTRVERTLVLLVQDAAVSTNGRPSAAVMESRLAAVNSNYLEYSYNMAGLAGYTNQSKAADIVGWYNYSGPADFDLSAFMAIADTNANVDFTKYTALMVVLNAKTSSTLSAWSSLGKVALSTPDGVMYMGWTKMSVPNASTTIITHEFGHIFGTGESSFLDCGSQSISETGRTYVAYGDPYDVMSSSSIGHFSAKIKNSKGWLSGPNYVMNITTGGVYALEPFETNTGGLKALRIQRTVDEAFYIEYRRPLGADAAISPSGDAFTGALFHVEHHLLNMTPPALPYSPLPPNDAQLTPTLRTGVPFVDPATGHRFTVLSVATNLLTIEIQHSGFEFNPPAVQMLAPTGSMSIAGSLLLSALATDDTVIDHVEFWFVRNYTPTLLMTTTNHNAGGVYSNFFNSVGGIPNGAGQLKARAYDQYSNYTDSALVDITVSNSTDSTPPVIVINSPTAGITTNSNSVHIQATASDNQRLWMVAIIKDGNTNSPFYTGISTGSVHVSDSWIPSGPCRLKALAYDFEGNRGESPEISFNVINDTDLTSPWGQFTSPQASGKVSGPIVLSLDAGDNVAITSVVFNVIDGFTPMATFTGAPYRLAFDTRTLADGFHMLRGQVRDSSGNAGMPQVMFEVRQDGDGDGMQDWWEVANFGGTNVLNGAAGSDADGDGMSNLSEYIAGTDPTNRLSLLEVTGLTQSTSGASLLFSTVSGKLYSLECKDSLSLTNWGVLSSNIDGSGLVVSVTDTNAPVIRFYRIGVQ